jgi:polysaccharide export outer membrane protein
MRSKRPSVLCLFAVVVGVALSSHLQGQTAKTALDEHATAAAAAVKLHDTANEYVIGPDDLLSVNVWKEPEISRNLPVRPDGNISLPLVGDLMASGRTPVQLQNEIRQQLVTYLSNPEVTVVVQEAKSHRFNIVGEVDKPGSYVMSSPMTVLDAIALAGGLRDFAKETKIYVLRVNADGSRVQLPFNYKRVIKGSDLKADVQLEPRDTIVVP